MNLLISEIVPIFPRGKPEPTAKPVQEKLVVLDIGPETHGRFCKLPWEPFDITFGSIPFRIWIEDFEKIMIGMVVESKEPLAVVLQEVLGGDGVPLLRDTLFPP